MAGPMKHAMLSAALMVGLGVQQQNMPAASRNPWVPEGGHAPTGAARNKRKAAARKAKKGKR